MLLKCTIAALASTVACQTYQGFNYGSTNPDGSGATQYDFEALFNAARNLQGYRGFTSARLYTMIQYGTVNGVTEAIPAAIQSQTSLLLGLWASAGQDAFNDELSALSAAIDSYGSPFLDLIAGISVGSEDLYRITPTGIANHAGVGEGPDVIASYIQQTRDVLNNAGVTNVKVGHVDTWTAWVNASNAAAIDASDFCGMDAYPYFQTVNHNQISNGAKLFNRAYHKTLGSVGSCEVWITETGWPLSGPTSRNAVASVEDAQQYWDAVACKYLGQVNTWWYTLYDGSASPSFGLVGSTLSSQPLFDLECGNVDSGKRNASEQGSSSPTTSTSSSAPAASSSNEPPMTSASSAACSTELTEYQYPHLGIAIDSSNPDVADGPSGNGQVSPNISTIFNFDIPSSYADKTCSLVFLFPEKQDLQTSDWTVSGSGGIDVKQLSYPATVDTTYNTAPSVSGDAGSIESLQPGNSYIIAIGPCAAGQTVSYELTSTGDLSLEYFQDSDPSPIGLFITMC